MKRVIALTDQAMIEKIYEVAKLDHRATGAETHAGIIGESEGRRRGRRPLPAEPDASSGKLAAVPPA